MRYRVDDDGLLLLLFCCEKGGEEDEEAGGDNAAAAFCFLRWVSLRASAASFLTLRADSIK